MTASLALSPVVSYPREAEVGRTYLLTVDFQAPEDGIGWAYPGEEYVVHCELDAAPLFSHRPLGDPAVVLHRFGGSYGPASFLLTAAAEQSGGEIVLHLSSAQGMPLASLTLPDITIKARGDSPQRAAPLPAEDLPAVEGVPGGEVPEVLGNLTEEEFFPSEVPPAPPPASEAAPDAPIDHELAARVVERLRDYWITSAEELVDVARGSNQQYGSGLRALAVDLGVEEEAIAPLVQAAAAAVPATPDPNSLTPLTRVFGLEALSQSGARYLVDSAPWLWPPAKHDGKGEGGPRELPGAVEPPAIPLQQPEGQRNACVAFVLTSMYQILSADPTDLSEQFLYWMAKQHDGIAGDVGTNPLRAIALFREQGVCLETTWPYNPNRREDHQENPGQGPPPPGAEEEARLRRIGEYQQIPAKDVVQIKAALESGWPVLLGLSTFEHWHTTWQGSALGKRRRSLPGERRYGGFAVCLFGYQDDPDAPGGGFFWANGTTGHLKIAYDLVSKEALTAIAGKGIDAHPGPTPEQVEQEVSAETGAAGEAWLDLRAGAPDAAPLATNGLGPDGRPLVLIDEAAIAALVRGAGLTRRADETPAAPPQQAQKAQAPQATLAPPARDDRAQQQLYRRKHELATAAHLGVIADVDPLSLEESRWAVVVSAADDARVLEAIWPLVVHRMEQMGLKPSDVNFREGESAGEWLDRHSDGGKQNLGRHWGEVPPVLAYRPGERANAWLARHGVSQGPVDPRRGVPYYLLLLGRPGPIAQDDEAYLPPEFQRDLGVFWAPGRLCFSDGVGAHDLGAYRAFAETRVRAEMEAYSATAGDNLFAYVADAPDDPLADSPLYHVLRERVGLSGTADAASDELLTMLRGKGLLPTKGARIRVTPDGRVAGLFVLAGHGLGLSYGDSRVLEEQGAMVIHGAPDQGPLSAEDLLKGEDIRRASLHGVALLLTSFGAGCPAYDMDLGPAGEGGIPLAPFALIARLPQRLLSAGLGAVIAPYGRFWHPPDEASALAFGTIVAGLRDGHRAGEIFNDLALSYARAAIALSEELENIRFGKTIADAELAHLWLARASLRNLMLLGDPAVRLPGDTRARSA